MSFRRHVVAPLALFALLGLDQPTQACAVATTVRVENAAGQPVRALEVISGSAGQNQAPPAGVAPGDATTITLPSCIGIYGIRVTFLDGRVALYPDLNAERIRGLTVR